MQTLGGGVAIEAHNDRLGTAELGDRFEDAVGDFHAGGDAAIDIDEHGFDLRVGQYDLRLSAMTAAEAPPPMSRKLAGLMLVPCSSPAPETASRELMTSPAPLPITPTSPCRCT